MINRMKLIDIKPAKDGVHKFVAHFILDTGRDKFVKFGAKGYTDYTLSKDPERKSLYLKRHKSRENWSNPLTPGSLSRWVLWEELTVEKAVQKFRQRFSV